LLFISNYIHRTDIFIRGICDLQEDVIVWGNRFNGQPDLENILVDCMISTDCLDCPCSEPFPATKDIYSKKHNGPGINRIRATVPLTGQAFGVIFLRGRISLKNRT
jgi:hypothetical protein